MPEELTTSMVLADAGGELGWSVKVLWTTARIWLRVDQVDGLAIEGAKAGDRQGSVSGERAVCE